MTTYEFNANNPLINSRTHAFPFQNAANAQDFADRLQAALPANHDVTVSKGNTVKILVPSPRCPAFCFTLYAAFPSIEGIASKLA